MPRNASPESRILVCPVEPLDHSDALAFVDRTAPPLLQAPESSSIFAHRLPILYRSPQQWRASPGEQRRQRRRFKWGRTLSRCRTLGLGRPAVDNHQQVLRGGRPFPSRGRVRRARGAR